MRLRESIRLPDRLNEGAHPYNTTPRRVLRRTTRPSRITANTFNPKLPPAAFPTLDQPLPPKSFTNNENNEAVKHDTRKRSYASIINDSHDDHVFESRAPTRVDFEESPTESIDNLIASNGEFNSIYVENMARMAQAGLDTTMAFEKSMEDSDTEAEVDGPTIEPLAPSQWRNLSPPMQVEIFENVEASRRRPAGVLLGVSEEDIKEIERNRGLRTKQLEQEDKLLEAMRAKQLRAILRINHANWRASQIQPNVACKMIMRRYLRKIRKSTISEYLICPTHEFLRARRFLLKREVDASLAGDWGPVATSIQLSVDDLEYRSKKTAVPQPSPSDISAILCADNAASLDPSSRAADSISAQVSLLNRVGTKRLPKLKDILSCQGQVNEPPRWLVLSHRDTSKNYHHPNWDNHIETRLIKEEKEAQRRSPEGRYILPKQTFVHFPPLGWIFFDRPRPLFTQSGEGATTTPADHEHYQTHLNAPTVTSQTAADRIKPNGSDRLTGLKRMTFSMRIRQQIDGMMAEAHRRLSEEATGYAQQAALNGPSRLLDEIIWTPPASPSRASCMTHVKHWKGGVNDSSESAANPKTADTQTESSDNTSAEIPSADTQASSHPICEPEPRSEAEEQVKNGTLNLDTRSENESTGSADEYDAVDDEMVLVQVPV
ncbi:uncharacterized protein BP01DRAFT_389043 [Aspergillus saccharolyticus JOP 1030-1]|uniref:Uncharacterized protein n=1 Tax=Aspergillus saccharolyticus JOP 1030-1 TaxID=1450539 RepID=A0A318ZWF1_9EURO|nr:hypothetical protein BP01DRAFT_389043 [Aspergillus saccharolyticus JOP 1030-1]PYH48420.1 hypothetical protein BP01DRAFT_389043 [Aspergillus saccharolyticus JOP 1030-1]